MAALEPPEEPLPSDEDDDAHLPRERAGRKSLLTEDVHKAVMNALKAGGFVREACLYANIKPDTYYYWMRRGRAYDEHLDEGGAIIDGEDSFRLFWLEAGQSRAAAKIRALGTIAKAMMEGDWRPAAWYLERSDPQNWGRINRTEITGPGGGALTVQVTEVEARLSADVAARAERVRAERAAAAESETIPEATIVLPEVPELGTGDLPTDL